MNWSLGWTVKVRSAPGNCSSSPLHSFSCGSEVTWLVQIMEEDVHDQTSGSYYNPRNLAFTNWTGPWGRGGPMWTETWFNSSSCYYLPNSYSCRTSQSLHNGSETWQASSVARFNLTGLNVSHRIYLEFDLLWSEAVVLAARQGQLSNASASLDFDMGWPRRGNVFALSSISVF